MSSSPSYQEMLLLSSPGHPLEGPFLGPPKSAVRCFPQKSTRPLIQTALLLPSEPLLRTPFQKAEKEKK